MPPCPLRKKRSSRFITGRTILTREKTMTVGIMAIAIPKRAFKKALPVLPFPLERAENTLPNEAKGRIIAARKRSANKRLDRPFSKLLPVDA